MALDQNQVNRILGAARARNVSQVEDLWIDLQSIEGALEQIEVFLNIAQEVANRGDKEKAAELLLLLRQDLKAADREDELFDILHKAVRYSHRVKGIRHDLVEQYRRKYGERPGLEAVLSRTDLAGEGRVDEAVRLLDEAFYFQVGDYVFHARGWGIGKVVSSNPEGGEFVIDFARNRGQRMEAGMALTALERRGPEDLDVLLWTDKDRVRDLCKNDPLGLLLNALRSNGGKIQSRLLREKLGDVLEKTAWTRFWNKARKLAKADPQIDLGSGARAVISLRDVPLSRDEEVSKKIKQLRKFKDRIDIARSELIAARKDQPGDIPTWLVTSLDALTKNHGKKGTSAQRAAAVELALFREEAVQIWPQALPDLAAAASTEPEVDPETGEPLPAPVPEHLRVVLEGLTGEALPPVLQEVRIAEYRKRIVRMIPRLMDHPAATETLQAVLLEPASQTWVLTLETLKGLGRDDVILGAVTRILVKPDDYPEALTAFSRARLTGSLDMMQDRSNADVLVKALKVFDTVSLQLKGSTDRREKARLKSTVETLRTLISEKGQRIIGAVIEGGSEDEVRRVLQLVRQSPTLTPTIKRSTEKFVAKRFPELLATVATVKRVVPEEQPLWSTSDGRRKRERELSDIVNIKMEEVRIEIGKALEFGDISENAELDAARERQQRLADQAKRIEDELERVAIIDFDQLETDVVRVGTRVVVDNAKGVEETYKILGPWDLTDDDDTIISYMSALATGFINNKIGDTCSIDLPGGTTESFTIKAIDKAVILET